jgi:hypothetical protein
MVDEKNMKFYKLLIVVDQRHIPAIFTADVKGKISVVLQLVL